MRPDSGKMAGPEKKTRRSDRHREFKWELRRGNSFRTDRLITGGRGGQRERNPKQRDIRKDVPLSLSKKASGLFRQRDA